MLVNFTQNPARVARRHNIIGQILCNNAACAHHYVIAYCNTWQNNGISAYPTVFPICTAALYWYACSLSSGKIG